MEQTSTTLSRLFTDHGLRVAYERGDTVIRAGDIPSGVYMITDGWIKAYTLCGNGETNIVMGLVAGDIFPLEWAVSGDLRDVSFTALDASKVLRIPRERFARSLRSDPRISEAVLLRLAGHAHRLSDELVNMAYHSARERVASRMLALAGDFGRTEAGSKRIILDMRVPNEYIARSSNMTRETASREISRLARKKIIRHHDGRLIIDDPAALAKEAGR